MRFFFGGGVIIQSIAEHHLKSHAFKKYNLYLAPNWETSITTSIQSVSNINRARGPLLARKLFFEIVDSVYF